MKMRDKKLVFTQREAECDINCQLKITLENSVLRVSDENHHCATYIFSCGARVGLNGVELPKITTKCAVPNT